MALDATILKQNHVSSYGRFLICQYIASCTVASEDRRLREVCPKTIGPAARPDGCDNRRWKRAVRAVISMLPRS
jgi:hypothetical protein